VKCPRCGNPLSGNTVDRCPHCLGDRRAHERRSLHLLSVLDNIGCLIILAMLTALVVLLARLF